MKLHESLEMTIEQEVEKQSRRLLRHIFIDYLGLAQFFKIKILKIFRKTSIGIYNIGRKRNSMEGGLTQLWQDMLGPYYLTKENPRQLHEGMYLTLKDLTLSEWVPRSPGMIFAKSSTPLFLEYNKVLKRITSKLLDEQKFPLVDWPENVPIEYIKKEMKKIGPFAGSQEVVWSGSGALRFDQHNNLKLMVAAENNGFVEEGYPIILTPSAFSKLKRDIRKDGAIYVEELTGCLRKIPSLSTSMEFPFTVYSGMPKLALFVESRLNIKGGGNPDRLNANAWTALSNGAYLNKDFNLGYHEHEQEILDAIDSIMDCKREYFPQESIMLDIDDVIPRFTEAKFNYKKLGTFEG